MGKPKPSSNGGDRSSQSASKRSDDRASGRSGHSHRVPNEQEPGQRPPGQRSSHNHGSASAQSRSTNHQASHGEPRRQAPPQYDSTREDPSRHEPRQQDSAQDQYRDGHHGGSGSHTSGPSSGRRSNNRSASDNSSHPSYDNNDHSSHRNNNQSDYDNPASSHGNPHSGNLPPGSGQTSESNTAHRRQRSDGSSGSAQSSTRSDGSSIELNGGNRPWPAGPDYPQPGLHWGIWENFQQTAGYGAEDHAASPSGHGQALQSSVAAAWNTQSNHPTAGRNTQGDPSAFTGHAQVLTSHWNVQTSAGGPAAYGQAPVSTPSWYRSQYPPSVGSSMQPWDGELSTHYGHGNGYYPMMSTDDGQAALSTQSASDPNHTWTPAWHGGRDLSATPTVVDHPQGHSSLPTDRGRSPSPILCPAATEDGSAMAGSMEACPPTHSTTSASQVSSHASVSGSSTGMSWESISHASSGSSYVMVSDGGNRTYGNGHQVHVSSADAVPRVDIPVQSRYPTELHFSEESIPVESGYWTEGYAQGYPPYLHDPYGGAGGGSSGGGLYQQEGESKHEKSKKGKKVLKK